MQGISRSHMVTPIMKHIALIVMDKFSLVQRIKILTAIVLRNTKKILMEVVSIIFKD
jgi:hypothetical protein